MLRSEFLALLGLGQLPGFERLPGPTRESDKDPPICLGVLEGVPIRVECPPACLAEVCPLGHCQRPSYVVDLDLSREQEQALLTIRVCRICGMIYALVPERPVQK